MPQTIKTMNTFPRLALAVFALSIQCMPADLPKVAELKTGEQLSVDMTRFGYTITETVFVFTPDKLVIKTGGKVAGELRLTSEEKIRVDEYLNLVSLGERRRPNQEGFSYLILFSPNQKPVKSWSFFIRDTRKSSKPTLTLYALKNRVEEQQKPKVEEPAAPPKDGKPVKVQPPTPTSKDGPR